MLQDVTENYSPAQAVELSGFSPNAHRFYERLGFVGAVTRPGTIFNHSL